MSKEAKMAMNENVLLLTLISEYESWICQEKHKNKLNAIGMREVLKKCVW